MVVAEHTAERLVGRQSAHSTLVFLLKFLFLHHTFHIYKLRQGSGKCTRCSPMNPLQWASVVLPCPTIVSRPWRLRSPSALRDVGPIRRSINFFCLDNMAEALHVIYVNQSDYSSDGLTPGEILSMSDKGGAVWRG